MSVILSAAKDLFSARFFAALRKTATRRDLPRQILLIGSTVVLSGYPVTYGSCADTHSAPNIVLILADDLGYGDLSTYGGWISTPHLDALAKAGLRFTDFHSSGNVCSPTRAGLMTGRYQQRAGIPGVIKADPKAPIHDDGLQPGEITFPMLLKKAGYATGMFGKWHLGYGVKHNPTQFGFDEFIGYVSGNVDYFSHVDQAGALDWWHGQNIQDEPGYTTHLITRHAVEFIRTHKDHPFCLYLPYEPPHYPYQGPNDGPQRGIGNADRAGDGDGGKVRGAPKADPAAAKQTYAVMVQELDKGVGEIIATLQRHGLSENTFVFLTSDNGAVPTGSNQPLRGFKGQDYEGGHRVPGLAVWPGHIKPGVTDQLAIGLDIMPTVLELAGVSPPPDRKLDGASLLPLLLEGRDLGPRRLFWNGKAMRDGPWKLVTEQRGQAAPALFNLAEQPAETERYDLAAEHPDRVKAMLAAIEDWKEDVAAGRTRQPSDEARRR